MDDRDSGRQSRSDPEEQNRPPQQPYGRRGSPASPNDEKAFSVLSYIGLLWLVGLLADRDNPRVRFHVNQGIILSIFEFALAFSLTVVKAIVSAVFGFTFFGLPLFSWIGAAVNGLLTLAGWCLVLSYMLIGAIRAAQGRQEPLPLIGSLFTVVQ